MMPDDTLTDLAARLGQDLLSRGLVLAVAESCTGGLIAAAITDNAGSSAWFERGFITYSNNAKREMLGVDGALIGTHGAVSEAAAIAMAEGAVRYSDADLAVAVTGIAGPDGGSADKPVGTVWLAWAGAGRPTAVRREQFGGDRRQVRRQSAAAALQGLRDFIAVQDSD